MNPTKQNTNMQDEWRFGRPGDKVADWTPRIAELARHHAVMLCGSGLIPNGTAGWQGLHPAVIRAANPAAKVYRYFQLQCIGMGDSDVATPLEKRWKNSPLLWETVVRNDWCLRDGKGNPVPDPGLPAGQGYALDVGKPGIAEAWLAGVDWAIGGEGYDGIWLDIWTPDIFQEYYQQGIFDKNAPPAAYPNGQAWFERAWQPFVTRVTDGLHARRYRIIGNEPGDCHSTNPMCQWNRTRIDGLSHQRMCLNWDGTWATGDEIARRIGIITDEPLELWCGETAMPIDSPIRYATLAMFLIAQVPGRNQSINWNRGNSEFIDPLWDTDIGTPTGSAQKGTGWTWTRAYTEGFVALNAESDPGAVRTFPLPPGKFVDLAGVTQTIAFALRPHTGTVLRCAA